MSRIRNPRRPAWPLALLLMGPLALGLAFAERAQNSSPGGGRPATGSSIEAARGVTVFLVRHAEKSADDPRDPSLTEAGAARARELSRLLSAAGVTQLYSTPYRRTRATVAPLAAALELEVAEYDARDPAALVAVLSELPAGSVVVVAGHSNTTPGLFAALGGEARELEDSPYGRVIPEATYDRLYCATITRDARGELRTHAAFELRYGD